MSVSKKCFKTVWPKEPVPPVMSRVEFINGDIVSSSLIEILNY